MPYIAAIPARTKNKATTETLRAAAIPDLLPWALVNTVIGEHRPRLQVQQRPGHPLRALKVMKANYGRTGEEISLRWIDGVYVVDMALIPPL